MIRLLLEVADRLVNVLPGSVAWALADLIVDGKSDPDLAPLSVERFGSAHRDPAALEAACVSQYARRYTH